MFIIFPDSRLHVKQNIERPVGVQSNFRVFLDENLNHISKVARFEWICKLKFKNQFGF